MRNRQGEVKEKEGEGRGRVTSNGEDEMRDQGRLRRDRK